MGKVKLKKGDEVSVAFTVRNKFQFPMGKVKNNILCSLFIIIGKYRFVNLIFT